MSIRSLARVHRGLALFACNCLLALVALNLLAALLLSAGLFGPLPPGSLRYGWERLAVVYPGYEEDEIEQLLRETWGRQYVYEPFVQHREGRMEGRWVNVDPTGFRVSAAQGPWPPATADRSVFVYGGSTAFGYGVADWETIPSRLQERLNASGCERPIRVYNFGRGNYYSEQERALFGRHLTAGHVPAAAVFLDGLNEWKDEPKFTARLSYLLREPPAGLWRRAIRTLPLIRLARHAGAELGANDGETLDLDDQAYGAAVVERWLASRRLVTASGGAFGVHMLFVWQPVPTYRYELEHHLFRDEAAAAFARHGPLKQGYARLDSLRRERPELGPEAGFLWLADLQVGRREPLYLDAVHYTAAFSGDIAERIAESLATRLGCGAAGAASSAQPE